MKAISLRQPYATLAAHGPIWLEPRDWCEPAAARQVLAIHAGKSHEWDHRFAWHGFDTVPAATPYGAIVAVARCAEIVRAVSLEAAVLTSPLLFAWRSALRGQRFEPGMYHYVLLRPWRLAHPVPWPGERRIFEVPDAALIEELALAGEHVKLVGEYASEEVPA